MNNSDAIQAIKKQRLEILLRQQAQFGYHAPPHILMEIKELKTELGLQATPDALDPAEPPSLPTDQVQPVQPVISDAISASVSEVGADIAPDDSLPVLIDQLKRRWLVAFLIVWLIFVVVTLAAIVQAFEPPSCLRWMLLGLPALVGGGFILLFSLLPSQRQCYRNWDRLLTLILVIAVVSLAFWYGYPICSQPNSVPLSANSAAVISF